MRGGGRAAMLPTVTDLRRLHPAMAPLAAALALVLTTAGCGSDDATPDRTAAATAAVAPPDASRPTAPAGPTLVRLQRVDGRFRPHDTPTPARHDTLPLARSGRASLLLAHGGGGFRKAACTLDAASLRGLRRDLRRLPV